MVTRLADCIHQKIVKGCRRARYSGYTVSVTVIVLGLSAMLRWRNCSVSPAAFYHLMDVAGVQSCQVRRCEKRVKKGLQETGLPARGFMWFLSWLPDWGDFFFFFFVMREFKILFSVILVRHFPVKGFDTVRHMSLCRSNHSNNEQRQWCLDAWCRMYYADSEAGR